MLSLLQSRGSRTSSRTLIGTAGLKGQTVAAASTTFSGPYVGGFNATENQTQWVVPFACSIKNLTFVTSGAQPGTGTLTVIVRKNGVDTALTLVVAAGAVAGVFTAAGGAGVAFAQGDLLSFKFVNAAPAVVSATVSGASVTAE